MPIDCYVAGNSYQQKDNIKGIVSRDGRRVFSWDGVGKMWRCKHCPDEAFDKLAEIVARKCPGCTLEEVGQTASPPPTEEDWPPKDEEVPF